MLARSPIGPLARGFLGERQRRFFDFARAAGIRWGDAKSIPVPDGSAEAIYTSHMLEHLDPGEAVVFLREAKRALMPGGVLRVGVPDLAEMVRVYQSEGDADALIAWSGMARPKPRGLLARLKHLALDDPRRHNWLYDGASLAKLLAENGFREPAVMPAGTTRISRPGELDLVERAEATVFVEALR